MSNRIARQLAVVSLMFFLFSPPARGDASYLSAKQVAADNGLAYKESSSGEVHSCRISGKGHEFSFFADAAIALVDTGSVVLSSPARWQNGVMEIPGDGAELIRRCAAESVAPPPALPRPTIEGARGALQRGSRPFKVVLDPGHGGKAVGTSGLRTGLEEKDVNLDIALRVARYLRARGVAAVMTRSTDVYTTLDDRVAIAVAEAPDMFISIHANAEPTHDETGSMTLYPDDGLKRDASGVMGRAREAIRDAPPKAAALGADGPVSRDALLAITSAAFEGYRLESIEAARTIQSALRPVTGSVERANGVIEDWRGLAVLHGARCPAVLVEVDFLSNRSSEAKLARPAYRASIAEALAGAVVEFLEGRDPAPEGT